MPSAYMPPQSGAHLIASSLHALGVRHVFGIVGIPVIEVAEALLDLGVQFISFRNEQAASYAASAYGYLTGRPGVCLVVGGPGVIHALAGVHNSMSNTTFPLLLLAGAAPTTDSATKGSFQQLDAVALLGPLTKLAIRPPSLDGLPAAIRDAYQAAFYGRPGATYVDLPANFIQAPLPTSDAPALPAPIPSPPAVLGDPARISAIAEALSSAQRPLIIIGKGASYSRCESELRELIARTLIPFLPTPQGKGVLPDSHALNASSARSTALKSADFILLLGARVNWILHFGTRFSPSAQLAQVDISAEELGRHGLNSALSVVGSIPAVLSQLLSHRLTPHPPSSPWRALLSASAAANESKALALASTPTAPHTRLSYHRVFHLLHTTLSSLSAADSILYVSEGANTMDISRSTIPIAAPRSRLDAGTSATMGVGLGYAIAAAVAEPGKRVVAIEGDSAFGFSLAEVETMARYALPVVVVVMNNGGVYHGVADSVDEYRAAAKRSTSLGFETAYAVVAEGLGARGVRVRTEEELVAAVRGAWEYMSGPTVVDVVIRSGKGGKLSFGWQEDGKKGTKL